MEPVDSQQGAVHVPGGFAGDPRDGPKSNPITGVSGEDAAISIQLEKVYRNIMSAFVGMVKNKTTVDVGTTMEQLEMHLESMAAK